MKYEGPQPPARHLPLHCSSASSSFISSIRVSSTLHFVLVYCSWVAMDLSILDPSRAVSLSSGIVASDIVA